ncbi:MAG: geranylgeranylglycerol-phosphate geranylgeranyltransferase [Halobacteriaceae archaeon]
MNRGTVAGLIELTRPGNSVLAGGLTFVGAFVAGGASDAPVAVATAVAATVVATAAGMAINDYFDRDVDRINNPERPIPRGAVSARGALAFSVVLFLSAVVLAVTLPALAIAIAGVNLMALVAYTELFKGLPGVGNAVVAYLGGSTFLFGAAAARALGPAPVVLFLLAALSTLAREIIKDVEDAPGDRAEGLRTLPIVVGERRALWLAAALLVVAVAASPLPYLRGTLGPAYLALVVPADVLMLSAMGLSFSDPGRGHVRLKYGMGLAAVAFVVGRGVALV